MCSAAINNFAPPSTSRLPRILVNESKITAIINKQREIKNVCPFPFIGQERGAKGSLLSVSLAVFLSWAKKELGRKHSFFTTSLSFKQKLVNAIQMMHYLVIV